MFVFWNNSKEKGEKLLILGLSRNNKGSLPQVKLYRNQTVFIVELIWLICLTKYIRFRIKDFFGEIYFVHILVILWLGECLDNLVVYLFEIVGREIARDFLCFRGSLIIVNGTLGLPRVLVEQVYLPNRVIKFYLAFWSVDRFSKLFFLVVKI
jgi:hypothetical protein